MTTVAIADPNPLNPKRSMPCCKTWCKTRYALILARWSMWATRDYESWAAGLLGGKNVNSLSQDGLL